MKLSRFKSSPRASCETFIWFHSAGTTRGGKFPYDDARFTLSWLLGQPDRWNMLLPNDLSFDPVSVRGRNDPANLRRSRLSGTS